MTKTRRSIHLAFRLSLALVTGLTWAGLTWASPDKRADAEAMTMTMALAGLSNAYQKAAPSARSRALQRLLDTAAERQALLMELIEDDPGAVLRTAPTAELSEFNCWDRALIRRSPTCRLSGNRTRMHLLAYAHSMLVPVRSTRPLGLQIWNKHQ